MTDALLFFCVKAKVTGSYTVRSGITMTFQMYTSFIYETVAQTKG